MRPIPFPPALHPLGMQRGSYLAVGTNQGEVQIWDPHKIALVRTMTGHRTRAGALAWGSSVLSSGSRDRTILQRDIRSPQDSYVKLLGHKSEVCALAGASGCGAVGVPGGRCKEEGGACANVAGQEGRSVRRAWDLGGKYPYSTKSISG